MDIPGRLLWDIAITKDQSPDAVVPLGTYTYPILVNASNAFGGVYFLPGATLQDGISGTSDSRGVLNVRVPQKPGCYQYKAFLPPDCCDPPPNFVKSNTFFLSVVAHA